MKNALMLGLWRYMIQVPPHLWERTRAAKKEKLASHLAFMTQDHRRVHHLVVRELPRAGVPLSPGFIAAASGLSASRVAAILDDLEEHMTFLFRNVRGEVVWAYPVTVEKTPHHVTFSTGETLYAA